VVGAGATLLEIVPDAAPRMVEALVANRDIGAVRLGQAVAVKAEAYNFTRYGTVPGRVARLAADAAEGPDRQLRFNTGIALEAPGLMVDGQQVPFTPGMTVTVEFALGQRRALDFLLSPLRRYRAESAREP
jgi:hemolysin D